MPPTSPWLINCRSKLIFCHSGFGSGLTTARILAGISAKPAVTVLLPVMVIVIGLVVPVASSLHPENVKPAFGVAVTLTVAPSEYFARSGSRVMVPPAPAIVLRRHWPGGKS